MEYLSYLLKKMTKSMIIHIVLVLIVWGTLYKLTDFATVERYFLIGIGVCALNTLIYNLIKGEVKSVFMVQGNWVITAGAVLVLYHAGFEAAAVLVAAAAFASPFCGASIYEGIVGLTLLIILA